MLSSPFLRALLGLIDTISPYFGQKIRVMFAVSREKGHRPHPFSLWTGEIEGKPDEGRTADTAVAESRNAPGLHFKTIVGASAFTPSAYVSWPGLVDRRYTGRHLPPVDNKFVENLPDAKEVISTLIMRPANGFVASTTTSTLFCFFAQWFTDSFLRTDPHDRRRNTSNHEIDYCQIYGLDERTTYALRARTGGRMKLENGHLPRLVGSDGKVKQEFADLSYVRQREGAQAAEDGGDLLRKGIEKSLGATLGDDRWKAIYASGLERGNSTLLYSAISTLCLREHNRLAAAIAKAQPGWDDDRLFESTRLVMIRNVLQIVMEDYINHIAGGAGFRLQRHFAENQSWYRTNRISLEFNLLYRWHSLVPDTFSVCGQEYAPQDYRYNNLLLEKHGIEACINAASTQPAGRYGLYNTPSFLWDAEMATLNMSRTFNLQPFVAYCERFSIRPPQSIAELTGGNQRATADLTKLYGTIENVELPVGLVAQAHTDQTVLPELTTAMVAVDAFTHILTNPILADQVYDAAFTDILAELAGKGRTIKDLMREAAGSGTTINASFAF